VSKDNSRGTKHRQNEPVSMDSRGSQRYRKSQHKKHVLQHKVDVGIEH